MMNESPKGCCGMKTLALDLDGKYGLSNFMDRIWILKYLGLKILKVRVYHTTNGFHAKLTCDNQIDDVKAVLIQVLLGDDYRRGVANLLKVERGCKNWNFLFKQKWKVDKLGDLVQVSKESYDQELSGKVLRAIQLGE
jgi:hypothetical protein